jgi:hypothetical protein
VKRICVFCGSSTGIREGYAAAGIPDLRFVESMHERKALMAELSDAFIAMSSGYDSSPKSLVARLLAHQIPQAEKWMSKSQT